tara:strand:+ start:1080 stop:1856 length:777 start_codon:yes stop_codon:yes gene_type:complete
MYVDHSPEWTSGVSEGGVSNDPSRCGNISADLDLFSSAWGVGTVINTYRSSSYAMKRMARINFHSAMNHKDRALFHAYQDIERAATVLGLPTVIIKNAKVLYRKFNNDTLTRGAVRTGIKANCVLFACKVNNFPRTTREIADAFSIPTKDISRTSNMIKEALVGGESSNKVTRPSDVVGRLLNEFGTIDGRTRMKCVKVCKSLENCVQLMSKTPNSIASAVILYVLGDNTNRSEVCKKCSISAPTLVKIENIVKQHIS